MTSLASLAPGDVLRGKYRVERVLGSGGMGVVVSAMHLRISQRVAIKLLLPDARNRDDIVRRFAREARAAGKLRSEHAVRILDVDDSEAGDPFLVMEHLEGQDLQRHLATHGPLSLEDALEYVLQACEGIAEAHAVGIVHRDLKPANLFLTSRPDGSALVKILDFGISKAIEPEAPETFLITVPATAIGSPAYMSPEQLRNAAAVDARTDLWSLGVVLYQLLTNALPFEATTTASLAARIAADPPTSIRSRRPDLPEGLEGVIDRCLAKDPGARFADVAALAEAIAPFAKRGRSGAERIARVVLTSAARGASVEEPDAAGASGPSSGPAAAPGHAGPATVSLHEASPTPLALHEQVQTEYGSAVGLARAPTPQRAPLRWLVAAVVGLLVIGGATWSVLRHGSRGNAGLAPPSAAAPPPPVAALPSSTKERTLADAAPLSPPRPATPPASSASSASSASPAHDKPRPKPAPKNPMDLDFR